MNQLIGCCGLNCKTCDARIATIENDDKLREKTAKLWSELNGVVILPEMINCTGCLVEGVKTIFCDKFCKIRSCALKKGLNNCGECIEMEKCENLAIIAKNNPCVIKNLKCQQNNYK